MLAYWLLVLRCHLPMALFWPLGHFFYSVVTRRFCVGLLATCFVPSSPDGFVLAFRPIFLCCRHPTALCGPIFVCRRRRMTLCWPPSHFFFAVVAQQLCVGLSATFVCRHCAMALCWPHGHFLCVVGLSAIFSLPSSPDSSLLASGPLFLCCRGPTAVCGSLGHFCVDRIM